MPLASFISDLYNSIAITEVYAEAPPAESKEPEQSSDDSKTEDTEETAEEEQPEPEQEDEEEEEEEEEDEPEDILPKLQEDCENSSQCKPAKHHYDECVDRVTAAEGDEDHKGPKEDCVEEYFHLMHCAAQCAAPKLFAQLK